MDTGLHSLVAIARFHQLPAEPDQLFHQFGEPGKLFTDTEVLLAAKALTLKAKLLSPALSDLQNALLPAIAKTKNGHYIILARLSEEKHSGNKTAENTSSNKKSGQSKPAGVLIHDLRDGNPKSISIEEFEALWSGPADSAYPPGRVD